MGYPSPNTGICALEFLMNFDLKKLFMCGFSFYKTSKMYYDGHFATDISPQHAQSNQIQYFKQIYQENKNKIDVDEFIGQKILLNKKTITNKKRLEDFKNGRSS